MYHDQFLSTRPEEVESVLDPRGKAERQDQLQYALELVTTDYVTRLNRCEILPVPDDMHHVIEKPEQAVRFYHLTKATYAPKENFLQKAATVLYTAYAQNTPVMVLIRSDGRETDYYLGVQLVVPNDGSYGQTFQQAFLGNFPGSELSLCTNDEVRQMSREVASPEHVAAISGLPSLRGEDRFSIEGFVQGIENMVDSLHGCSYTLLVRADPVQRETLLEMKNTYEMIYSELSSFAKTSYSFNQTDTSSYSHATGTTHTQTAGQSSGGSTSKSTSETHGTNHSIQKPRTSQAQAVLSTALMAAGTVVGGIAGSAATPAGTVAGAAIGGAVGSAVGTAAGVVVGTLFGGNVSDGTSESKTTGKTATQNYSFNSSSAHSTQETRTETEGDSYGRTLQFTYEDKKISDTLKIIDENIKRLDLCTGMGAFASAAYVLSSSEAVSTRVAAVYNALTKGERSALQATHINRWSGIEAEKLGEYLHCFIHPQFNYCMGQMVTPVTPALLVSSNELTLQIGLPKRSFPGVTVINHAQFSSNPPKGGQLQLGQLYRMGTTEEYPVCISLQNLTGHTFITGSTGSGKSNTVYHILDKLGRQGVKFLVIEPAKGEYKNVFGGREDVAVYGTNSRKTPLLRLNPFSFPDDIHVLEHIDRLIEIFNACWPMYAAMPAVLKDAVEQSYRRRGWNLTTSFCASGEFPTFHDLMVELPQVIEQSAYSADTKGDYIGALVTRVNSLVNGLNGQIFCSSDELPAEELFDRNVIIDLSRVGSMDTKALLMGILVMKLQEHRMAVGDMNAELNHVTVLEEAHNLLRRTSDAQSQESSNLRGQSVEMIANAIAEMRTYGEGFIIADQAPGLMDQSVIRNTNTKIIMRLPDQTDRELVGKAASLNDEQIVELAKLPRGVAAVYQNDWLEPALCKINHFETLNPYHYEGEAAPECFTRFFRRLFAVSDDVELSEEEIEKIKRWIERLPETPDTRKILLRSLNYEPVSLEDQKIIAYNLFEGKQMAAVLEQSVDEKSAIEQIDRQIASMYSVNDQTLAEHIRQLILRSVFEQIDAPRLRDRFGSYMMEGGVR